MKKTKTIEVKFEHRGNVHNVHLQYQLATLSVINLSLVPDARAVVVLGIGEDENYDRTEEILGLDIKYRQVLARAALAMFEYALNNLLQGRQSVITIWGMDGEENTLKRIEGIRLVLPELEFFLNDVYDLEANFCLAKPVKPRFSKNFDFKVVTND